MNQYQYEAEHLYKGRPTGGTSGGKRGSCPECNSSGCCAQYPGGSWCFKCNKRVGDSTTPAAPRDDSPRAIEARAQKLHQVWSGSKPIEAGDPVDTYLRSRGLNFPKWPSDLQLHPGLEYWAKDSSDKWVSVGEFPCMVALIRNPEGRPVSVHRTFLKPDGSGKADLSLDGAKLSAKTFMPFTTSGTGSAIRLAEPAEIMAVAEGIETALAVMQMTGKPTWAARDAGALAKIELPPAVREVWIAADNDTHAKGIAAARKLERKLQPKGYIVRISMPDAPGADWLDVLVGKGQ